MAKDTNKKNKIKKLIKPPILVIGDVMVDAYIEGDVKRISPEAPVPILEIKSIDYSLGGAANVAKNLLSFGIIPHLIGYIGDDAYGKIFRELVKKDKIKHKLFHTTITTSKRRYGYPQMLRVDWEEKVKVKGKEINQIIQYIKKIKPSVIIISDYAKGSITQSLFDKVVKLSKIMKFKLLVDPKPKNNIYYRGCFLMTPNFKEAVELSDKRTIKEIGEDLRKKYKCNILITRGEKGMDLFYGNSYDYTLSVIREVYNVSGAGDSVISSMAYLLSLGWSLNDAMRFANKIAGDVVSIKSTSLSKEIVEGAMEEYGNKN